MHQPATCPHCSATFDARKAVIGTGGLRETNAVYQREVTLRVRCPTCTRTFSTNRVRLFGVLSPNALRVVVVGLLVVVVGLAFVLPPR